MSCNHAERVPFDPTLPGWRVGPFIRGDLRRREAFWMAQVGLVDALYRLAPKVPQQPCQSLSGAILVRASEPWPSWLDPRDRRRVPKPSKLAAAHPEEYAQAEQTAQGVDPGFVAEVCLPTALSVRCRLLSKGSPAPADGGWLVPDNAAADVREAA